MKKTLLTTTALVSLAGAATAEITVSGTARLGLQTTEGTAAVVASTAYGTVTAEMITSATAANTAGGAAIPAFDTAAGSTSDADDITALDLAIAAAAGVDLESLEAIKAALEIVTAAAVKGEDETTAKNRVRVAFSLSGETDSGLAFGASIRADNAGTGNSGTGGSQHLSGSFGKISMGDLNGADEDMIGDISAMSFGGLGSNQEHSYQSNDHNLAYSISMAGINFGVSTHAGGGSSTAMGLNWSGDLGGGTVTVGLGQLGHGRLYWQNPLVNQ